MAIFRIQKNENYTVMSNYHLRDMNLSLKARGLMSLMLSLPDNWNFSVQGLLTLVKESKVAVDSALAELKEHGYLVVTKINNENGQFEYIYDLYESPMDNQEPCNNEPDMQNLYMENHPQLNTNIINKEEQNTESIKEKNTKKEKSKEPTVLESLKEYESLYNLSSEVMEALEAFTDMRKRIKKPLSLYALKLLMKRLIELSGNDQDKMVEILNQSIFNSWQGIFAVKKDTGSRYEPEEDVIEKLKKKYEAEGI